MGSSTDLGDENGKDFGRKKGGRLDRPYNPKRNCILSSSPEPHELWRNGMQNLYLAMRESCGDILHVDGTSYNTSPKHDARVPGFEVTKGAMVVACRRALSENFLPAFIDCHTTFVAAVSRLLPDCNSDLRARAAQDALSAYERLVDILNKKFEKEEPFYNAVERVVFDKFPAEFHDRARRLLTQYGQGRFFKYPNSKVFNRDQSAAGAMEELEMVTHRFAYVMEHEHGHVPVFIPDDHRDDEAVGSGSALVTGAYKKTHPCYLSRFAFMVNVVDAADLRKFFTGEFYDIDKEEEAEGRANGGGSADAKLYTI